MKKFDVAIDFGSYYVDSVEAETKEQAVNIAMDKYKADEKFDPEVCNIDCTEMETTDVDS